MEDSSGHLYEAQEGDEECDKWTGCQQNEEMAVLRRHVIPQQICGGRPVRISRKCCGYWLLYNKNIMHQYKF